MVTRQPTRRQFLQSAGGAGLGETVLVGVVAYRVGQPFDWDAEYLRATNCPDAEPLIRPPRRAGWK